MEEAGTGTFPEPIMAFVGAPPASPVRNNLWPRSSPVTLAMAASAGTQRATMAIRRTNVDIFNDRAFRPRKRWQTRQAVMLSRDQMLLNGAHHVKQACVSGVPRDQDKTPRRHWDGRYV